MSASRVWTQAEIEAQLRSLGLVPTDATTATGRFWKSPQTGRHVQVPDAYEGMYPNFILSVLKARLEELGFKPLH